MKDIDLLFAKYFKGNISDEEMSYLQDWVSNNETSFKEVVKINFSINSVLKNGDKTDTDISFSKFLEQTKNVKVIKSEPKKRWSGWLKYAAVFVVLITSSYYLLNNKVFVSNDNIEETNSVTEISLTLGDGTVKRIDTNINQDIYSEEGTYVSTQNKDELIYGKSKGEIENKDDQLSYNVLSIPYGRIFRVSLADGTRVVLNAGSSLKYPETFSKDEVREVFLEGEALFEVTNDVKRPFLVNTTKHKIRVLGTQFNVNSYEEDQMMHTVLVEGSVGIYKTNDVFDIKKSTLLSPGEKATWTRLENTMSVEKTNVDQYTAWTKGELIFVNQPFKQMIKRLERHYNVKIENNYLELGKSKFSATFKGETIDQVMNTIQKYSHFSYKIENNKIIINHKNQK